MTIGDWLVIAAGAASLIAVNWYFFGGSRR